MTITTVHSIKSTNDRSGFSLVEVMIAASLGTILFAAILSSFIFVARSSFGIGNYSDMNSQSRKGLEVFGRDVRCAEVIHEGFSQTTFTIDVLNRADGTREEITYTYLPDHPDRPLMREDSSGEEALMTGIKNLKFFYHDLQAGEALVPLNVKQLQLTLTLVRRAVTQDNTEKVVSARYILRNKKVGE